MFTRVGIPYLLTAHAYDIFLKPDAERLKARFTSAEKVLTVSQYNRNYLLNLLGQGYEDKITVHFLGVDLEKFKYIERKPKDIVTILFVGRLIEKKGFLDAIETFKRILERHKSVQFRIIGDGPLREKALNRVNELEINEKVLFLGGLPLENVLEELKGADIFFLPSKTAPDGDREGLPVVILEAQAMDLPVVSTLHTGIPEAVVDGESAFLVPEGDIPAMADRICELIEAPDLRKRMGKAGRKWVESHFDFKRELDALEKIMLDIVHTNKTPLDKRISVYFPQVMEHLELEIRDQETQIHKQEASFNQKLKQQEQQIRQQEASFNQKLKQQETSFNQKLKQQEQQVHQLQAFVEGIKQTVAYRLSRKLKRLYKAIFRNTTKFFMG
jgi:hypothetical protein